MARGVLVEVQGPDPKGVRARMVTASYHTRNGHLILSSSGTLVKVGGTLAVLCPPTALFPFIRAEDREGLRRTGQAELARGASVRCVDEAGRWARLRVLGIRRVPRLARALRAVEATPSIAGRSGWSVGWRAQALGQSVARPLDLAGLLAILVPEAAEDAAALEAMGPEVVEALDEGRMAEEGAASGWRGDERGAASGGRGDEGEATSGGRGGEEAGDAGDPDVPQPAPRARPPPPIPDPPSPRPGTRILVVGAAPFGAVSPALFGGFHAAGIVSATAPAASRAGADPEPWLLLADLPCAPGVEGAPVVVLGRDAAASREGPFVGLLLPPLVCREASVEVALVAPRRGVLEALREAVDLAGGGGGAAGGLRGDGKPDAGNCTGRGDDDGPPRLPGTPGRVDQPVTASPTAAAGARGGARPTGLDSPVRAPLPSYMRGVVAVRSGASWGSGVAVGRLGHVLTAAHVVDGAQERAGGIRVLIPPKVEVAVPGVAAGSPPPGAPGAPTSLFPDAEWLEMDLVRSFAPLCDLAVLAPRPRGTGSRLHIVRDGDPPLVPTAVGGNPDRPPGRVPIPWEPIELCLDDALEPGSDVLVAGFPAISPGALGPRLPAVTAGTLARAVPTPPAPARADARVVSRTPGPRLPSGFPSAAVSPRGAGPRPASPARGPPAVPTPRPAPRDEPVADLGRRAMAELEGHAAASTVRKARRAAAPSRPQPRRAPRETSLLLSTATVHAGASGGALLDARTGRLLGLITSNAKHSVGGIYPNVNFSVPASRIRRLVDALERGEAARPRADSFWAAVAPLSERDAPVWRVTRPEGGWDPERPPPARAKL